MSGKVRIALLFSLLANVLLVGFLIGGLPHRFAGGREARVESVLSRLPEAARADFRARMAQNRAQDASRRDDIAAARQRTIDILLTEPFDAEAYDREVQRIDLLRGQGSRDMAQAVKDVAIGLPLEQRRVLAELLSGPPRRR